MEQRIKNQVEAKQAFLNEFKPLLKAVNALENSTFVEENISVNGEPKEVYLYHNVECDVVLIVPKDGSRPTAENFSDITILP